LFKSHLKSAVLNGVALNCTSHPLFSIVPAFNKAEYPVEVDNGIAEIWLIFWLL
jgi:hypothetical protein